MNRKRRGEGRGMVRYCAEEEEDVVGNEGKITTKVRTNALCRQYDPKNWSKQAESVFYGCYV